MSAAATFGLYMGTKNGETRLGPFSNRARAFSSNVWSPPVPVPTMAPTRCRSTLSQLCARHASVTACSAAPMANCANRSRRRISFLSRNRAGSNPFTSQANFTGLAAGSKRVIGPAPERPARRPSQVLCTFVPSGVPNPRPVIATRRAIGSSPILSCSYSNACPAVHDQHLTCNVAREVGRQKEHRRRHIGALSQPAQRNRLDQCIPGGLADGPRQLRIDESRRHGVDEDVTR